MEVKLGVTYSPRELAVETELGTEEITRLVESALGGKHGVLWLTDSKGKKVGVPTDKLAYVEINEDVGGKRVGFGS
jgi:Protein of unknown function (DUF3107)